MYSESGRIVDAFEQDNLTERTDFCYTTKVSEYPVSSEIPSDADFSSRTHILARTLGLFNFSIRVNLPPPRKGWFGTFVFSKGPAYIIAPSGASLNGRNTQAEASSFSNASSIKFGSGETKGSHVEIFCDGENYWVQAHTTRPLDIT